MCPQRWREQEKTRKEEAERAAERERAARLQDPKKKALLYSRYCDFHIVNVLGH